MRWIDHLLPRVRLSPRRIGRRPALRFESLEARDVPAVTGGVFRDAGGDGLRDPGDTGIAGVTVQLFSGDEAVGQSKTGPTGAYTFTTLEAATDYQLRVATTQAPLADLVPTQPDLGDDEANDSDFSVVEDDVATADFATETGDEALTFDAGFAP